jgi:cytochrome P450
MLSSAHTAPFPGPALSASEQVRQWVETPVEFWEGCERSFGTVVALELGSIGPVLLLSDPADVKAVFQLPSDRFECRHYNEQYRYLMGDRSLLLQDGATHMRQRRLLGPALRHEAILPDASTITDIVSRAVGAWPSGTDFNPRPDLHDVTFQVIVQTLFGALDSLSSTELLAAYRRVVLPQRGAWGPWRSFTRLQPRIRELLLTEILARRGDPVRPGVLTRLALATDAEGTPLSDEECIDHVFSLMIAGVDTTAVAVAWALYWLGREARVTELLTEELATMSRDAASEEYVGLPYLDAVYRETLRMYPVVPTPSGRRLLEATNLATHTIPAGTTLVPCTYLVHRSEDLYPQSGRFSPERFLERRFGSHEYFPFGGGVRRCIGEVLAELQFKVALTAILARWTPSSASGAPLRPIRHGTLLAPPDQNWLRVDAGVPTGGGPA